MMKYFTIRELIQSQTAFILGIKNLPTDKEVEHMVEMVDNLLDPLREAWGKPIYVTSGFRCKALNTAVGGSKTSAHQFGYAVDIVPKGIPFSDFVEFIKSWLIENNVAFDQFIIESNGRGSQWVHLGYKNGKGEQRRQFKQMEVK